MTTNRNSSNRSDKELNFTSEKNGEIKFDCKLDNFKTSEKLISIIDIFLIAFIVIKTIPITIYLLIKNRFMKPKSLKGKICLVTGAGRGLGRELCIQLAKQGAVVVCVDIREETNKETVKLIKDFGGKAHGYVCNIARHEEVQKLAATVQKEVGRVYMLINNAALIMLHEAGEWPPDDVVSMFNVNVISHYWTMQEFLPAMREVNEGHIVNILSLASKVSFPWLSVYGPTKAAAESLLSSLRLQINSENTENRIILSGVYPAIVNTSEDIKQFYRKGRLTVLDVTKAVEIIIEGIKYNKTSIYLPGSLFYIHYILRMITPAIFKGLLSTLDMSIRVPTMKLKKEMNFDGIREKCV